MTARTSSSPSIAIVAAERERERERVGVREKRESFIRIKEEYAIRPMVLMAVNVCDYCELGTLNF